VVGDNKRLNNNERVFNLKKQNALLLDKRMERYFGILGNCAVG
jgi:hypothetical protein